MGEDCGWAGRDGGSAVVFAQEDRDRASKSYIQKLLDPTYTNFRSFATSIQFYTRVYVLPPQDQP